MEMKSKKSAQRLLALILCVAMLLPLLPQSVWAEELSGAGLQRATPVNAVNKLEGLAYSGGNGSAILPYDCGDGLTDDGATSAIRIIRNTTAVQFKTYCSDVLEKKGLIQTYSRDAASSNGTNLFRKYKAADGSYSVYTYFLSSYGETRIIVDTNRDTVQGYQYTAGTKKVEPLMVQWGLSTSSSGYHIDTTAKTANGSSLNTGRENNGSLTIIRMPDNSLFFHDGGILAQMSDEAAAELLAFCRELTGTTGTREKMVINTWFLSHAHDDHFQGFTRFININHEEFDLKNVVYNIDIERTLEGGAGSTTPATKNIRPAMQRIKALYPNVRYYKPHTGEVFPVDGIEFDVLYAHEDRLLPDSSYNLSWARDVYKSGDTHKDIWDVGGTYRSGLYTGETHSGTGLARSDFNDTSTVLKVTFPQGTGYGKAVTAILYADVNLAETIITNNHPAATLSADIIMVPHHGFDAHAALVKNKAKIFLYTQNYQPIFGTGVFKRTDIADNFTTMFPNQTTPGGSSSDKYKIYWGGNETAIINIKKVSNLASTPNRDAIAACVETRKAMNFRYTGWTLFKASTLAQTGVRELGGYVSPAYAVSAMTADANMIQTDSVSLDDYVSPAAATGTDVSSKQNRYYALNQYDLLIQEGRYLIMSNKYGYIMAHDATLPLTIQSGNDAGTDTAGSFTLDADGDSLDTYYTSGGYLYLDHSDRDHAIWNLRQFKEAGTNGKTVYHNGAGSYAEDSSGNKNVYNGNYIGYLNINNFGGNKLYQGIELQKRPQGFDESKYGSYNPSNTYWFSGDGDSRFLCYNTATTPFKTSGPASNIRVPFIVEQFNDQTFVFYYKAGEDSFYFVCCDEYGTWGVKQYTKAQATANLANLKVKLYAYEELSSTKQVALSGYTTYEVDVGTSQDAVMNAIMENLVVSDPNRQNQRIPCSGVTWRTAKVGYYFVRWGTTDNEINYNPTVPGTYPVGVYYHNDNGVDKPIGTVNVKVVRETTYSIENSQKVGYVSQNSYSFVHLAKDSDVIAKFIFNDVETNITVDMLRKADGSTVDTSKPDTYYNLKLVHRGYDICTDFTLHVAQGTIPADIPAFPEPGSVTAGKGTTTSQTDFANTGVANIELSATAKPVEKGVDLIIIVDLSSSMRYYTTSNAYACGPKYNTNGRLNPLTTIKAYQDQNDLEEARNEFKEDYLAEHPGATQAEIDAEFTRTYNARMVSKVFMIGNGSPTDPDNWWANTRMYALEESLKTTIANLRDSGKDVNVAIADFGDLNHYEFGNAMLDDSVSAVNRPKYWLDADKNKSAYLEYEMSNHLNFILGRDNQYTGTKIPQPYHIDSSKWGGDGNDTNTLDSFVYTNTNKVIDYVNIKGTVEDGADAFQPVDTLTDTRMLEIVEMMRIQNGNKLGTNYDLGLETAYRLAHAKQKENEVNGEDRDIVCIFMSDGAAMQYNFMSGRSQSDAWAQYLIGETDEILTNNDDKYVLTSDHASSVKQAPALQEMIWRLWLLLKDGNLRKAGNANQVYSKYNGNSTDFFVAMNAIGVKCDWDLFFQIAYTNYTHAESNVGYYNGLKLNKNGVQSVPQDANFYENTMKIVIKQLRQPSFYTDAQNKQQQYQYQTLSDYYYFYNAEGKNWWAEALKGDKDAHYPVPNRKAHDNGDKIINTTNGDVLNHFSTETGLELDGKDYISGVQGLDVDLYTIGFSLSADNAISYEVESKVLDNVATGPAYHYEASSKDGLTDALKSITSSMSKSATGAYYMDTMGAEFDLSTVKTVNGVEVNQTPAIYVKEYILDESKPIYKDTNNDDVADEIVGYQRAKDADGNYIVTVRETIKFEAEPFGATSDKIKYASSGTKVAYSDLVFTVDGNGVKTYTDIWDDTTNVIFGRLVKYNANKVGDKIDVKVSGTYNLDDGDVVDGKYKIDLTGDGEGDQTLEPETFFWIIGVIGETEMVLEYQAYLEGSMEGEKDYKKDVYPTNKSAILYYTDYIGNKQSISTVSPKFPWGGIPQISHGFYVVDESGEPILKDGKLQIVGLVDYANITLNSTGAEGEKQYTKTSVDKIASGLFNSSLGYELYNPDATYTVVYNESKNNDNYNSWTTSDASKTTLVSVNGLEHSEATSGGTTTPNTVLNKTQVLFAVVQRNPDLVVNKYVEAVSGSANKFTLTLEAYTKYGACDLDSNSILKEVLSDYFILDPNDKNAVTVYTYACTGINDGVPAFAATGTQLTGATVKLSSSDGSGRKDIIEISGFDYAANYLRAYGDNLGCKLVVKVSIVTRDGFWGGNNVPTNEATTGIYNPGKNDPVETFPIPQVNVPISVKVTADNKTYYYGTDGKKGSDLNPIVTVNGTKVTINGDKLEPAQGWMDDFTDIKWNDDSNKPSSSVDGRNPADYTFSVTVTPKTDGKTNNTTNPDKPGNIVGTPVSTAGVKDEDTSYVSILYPELTFKDSTTAHNTPVEGYGFKNKDYVSEAWVITKPDGVPGSEIIPDVEGTAPTLTLTYTAEGNVTNFTTDTKVDVTVKVGNENITNVVTFKWEKEGCTHTEISSHKGSVSTHEFWVHVVNIVPDTVVIDFGLDVLIDVLGNDEDIKGKGYTITGLSLSDGSNKNTVSVEGTYGVLTLETVDGKQIVRYSLKNNGMLMKVQDTFKYYVVSPDGEIALSAAVTVIPATTIYFEDDFGSVTYKTYEFYPDNKDKADAPVADKWYHDASDSATQHEDRPGVDAANLYGFDGSYTTCEQFSLNGYHKFTANQKKVNGETVVTYGTAEFNFQGTGFDIVSMTSNTTGFITVQVYELNEDGGYKNVQNGKPVAYKNKMVDTYYGYKLVDGVWTPVDNATDTDGTVNTNTLYQVPVMKVSGMPYGKYKAVITISYNTFFDHGQDITDANGNDVEGYDFYLDAIRIYDPANDGATDSTGTIQGAYKDDGEGWPEYFELRNLLLTAKDFDSLDDDTDSATGAIFIDNTGTKNEYVVSNYQNFGPNNELYLAPGQAVAFLLNVSDYSDTATVASIQIALKSVGGTAKVRIYDAEDGEMKNVLPMEDDATNTVISTATDLYYDIFKLNGGNVVIVNEGDNDNEDAILSITNVKITYTGNHGSDNPSRVFPTVTRVKMMRAVASVQSLFANVGEEDPGEVVNGTIDLKGASLSFESEILTNLYYTVSGIEATEMGLLTWSSEPVDGTIDNAENVFVGATYDAQNDRYMVQTAGIAAKNLGDDIYMCVYAKTENGIVYSDVTSYSPKQYALSRLEKSENAEMKALCVAMLNYGAAAQEYFGYKTEDLMNASLTAEQLALVKAYDAALFAGAVAADEAKIGAFVKTEGFSKKTASVSFEGAFVINYYFTPSSNVSGDVSFCYWTAEDYANAEVLTAENASGKCAMVAGDGVYFAQITDVPAKALDSTYYVAAVYTDEAGNTCCTGVIAYSLSKYCMNNAYGSMGALAQATAMYGFCASEYFTRG